MEPQYWILTLMPMPEVVQSAFVADGHRDRIASREDIAPTVWWEIARSKPALPSHTMAELLRRDLNDEQISWVFANEKRASPLQVMISRNGERITAEHIAASKRLPAAAAADLALLEHLSDATRLQLATTAGKGMPAVMLAESMDPQRPDARVLPTLLDATNWWPSRPNRRITSATATLIELSGHVADELLDAVADIPAQLVTTLAGSHKLAGDHLAELAKRIAATPDDSGRFAAMAFAANPRVPIELAELAVAGHQSAAVTLQGRTSKHGPRHLATDVAQCQDPGLLQWVAYRAVPSEYRPAGKPWYLPAIVASPAFAELGDRVRNTIRGWDAPLPNKVAANVAATLGVDRPARGDTVWTHRPGAMSLDPASPADPPDLSKVRTIDFRYQRPSALGQLLEAVADRLGDDPATWRTFMSFAESPNLTLDEVLDLVEATR